MRADPRAANTPSASVPIARAAAGSRPLARNDAIASSKASAASA